MITLFGRKPKAEPKPYVMVKGLEVTADAIRNGVKVAWLRATEITIGPLIDDHVLGVTVEFKVLGQPSAGASVTHVALLLNGVVWTYADLDMVVLVPPDTTELVTRLKVHLDSPESGVR